MTAGLTLLVGGFVDVQLGIRKWGSPRWMVVSYWVWTGLLIATFVLGYTLLPRQLRQEKEAAKQRNPTTRLSRIQASFPDRDNKSKISPFPSANSPSPGVGSASKSKIKYPWHARRVGAGDMMGDIPMLEHNDRMNGLSVPPPSGGINRDETEGRDGNFGQRGRHGMWRAA
ncbi:hypothetical protein QFC21_006369 [Naganishia friedmannii]|uniref:Uncharacterized protein n=1 Tax=Naganishia friedmannii TaxID=89922 RepID=A0ACC2V2G2_9TREE|nr:hypothetical protein QFC21_006369 [Naganishia friedmannii]